MFSQISQITAQRVTPQGTPPEYYTSANWMSWAATAWSYFAPGVGVNPATGLHSANLEFPCFTDWDLAAYIMSIIYAYKLGLITTGGTCTDSQTSTWEFGCRIQDILNFLKQRQLMTDGTPYDFYSNSQSGGQYVQCPLTTQNVPTSVSDTGRLLGALSILESVSSSYDPDVNMILLRSQPTYQQFASTCCSGADYYGYLMGEGYSAFHYSGCNPCGVFAAVNGYSGPTYALNGQNLPKINTLAEPLSLEILLGQQHSTNTQFLNFAKAVYSVQEYNYTQVTGNPLNAWTEGSYPPHNYPTSYIYEWILVYLSNAWNAWQLTAPGYAQQGTPGGPPLGSPVLAFTKTAFSYLAIYGENPYTNAQVNAVSKLATSRGFGEATLQNGQSAQSLWHQTGDDNSFYSDKTQEQVLESAYYAIQNPPAGPQVGSISSVVSAGAGQDWFVLPDFTAGQSGTVMHTSAVKCASHVFNGLVQAALATDVYATTYLFGALTSPPQNEVLDTNPTYVSQSPSSSCGEPTASIPASLPLVAIAGPTVSEVVNYYEATSSPLYYNYGTGCITRRDTSVGFVCNFVATSTKDVFLMEAFTDQAGRTVYIIYGLNWPGTLAGFEYVVNFVLRNIDQNGNPYSYTASWYVYEWQDASSGVSKNSIPDPGDTYQQLANGP